MNKDGCLVVYDLPWEKVLGYNPTTDKMRVSCCSHSAGVRTKREILSQNSSIFDPLSLCLHVTVKGRILLRDLWKQKLGWDEKVPDE